MKGEGFRGDTGSAISDYPDLISDTTGEQQPGPEQCAWANSSSCVSCRPAQFSSTARSFLGCKPFHMGFHASRCTLERNHKLGMGNLGINFMKPDQAISCTRS
jgi:hypothetical protein